MVSTKKKILVVEDEDSIRSFIVINLTRAGYEVCEAGSGEDALEILAREPGIGVALLILCFRVLTVLNSAAGFALKARKSE